MKDIIEKILSLVDEYVAALEKETDAFNDLTVSAEACEQLGVESAAAFEEIRTALEQALAAKPGEVEPIGYLAFRDGEPAWDADDCVCEDPVYPVDADDDRTSIAIYTAPQPTKDY